MTDRGPRAPLRCVDTGDAASRLIADGQPVNCLPCSRHYGFTVPASIAMQPTTARRERGGGLRFDVVALVCARCLSRGVVTRY